MGELLPGEGVLSVAADIFLPVDVPAAPVALFCLPGGGMNRAYFNLRGAGGFSFAAHLAARGFIVVTLDHLGVGDSSRPQDGSSAPTPMCWRTPTASPWMPIRRRVDCRQVHRASP